MAQLQDELKALKVREGEAVASARELKRQLQELSDTWQVRARREGWPGRQGSRAERAPGPAGAPVPRRPLEGVPAEARAERAAGRADERASARGPGPGRGPRAAAARGGARDAGARGLGGRGAGAPPAGVRGEGAEAPIPAPQDNIHRNLLNRVEAERAALQEKLQYLGAQNKGLQTQLSESRRKQAEAECKVRAPIACNPGAPLSRGRSPRSCPDGPARSLQSKEEVMAVRLREADSMAAVAEMRQRIAELEIQVRSGGVAKAAGRGLVRQREGHLGGVVCAG